MCIGCPVGGTCLLGRDCLSGVCTAGSCAAPTCTDGVANGGETDVDCGGATSCPRCPDFDICTAPSDCVTSMCTMGRCGSTGCIPFPGGSTDTFGYFGCTIPMTPSTLPCPDISSTGTDLMQSDDDNDVVPIGFSFDFYGTAYTSVSVNSNGSLVFGGTYLTYSNACLPRTSTPTNFAAPFWDDLYPPGGGSVRYQTLGSAPNRQFVARWNVPHYPTSGGTLYDFTVVLNETTNDIEYCYDNVVVGGAGIDSGGSATVGINRGTDSLQFSCNTASLMNGLFVQFIHP